MDIIKQWELLNTKCHIIYIATFEHSKSMSDIEVMGTALCIVNTIAVSLCTEDHYNVLVLIPLNNNYYYYYCGHYNTHGL